MHLMAHFCECQEKGFVKTQNKTQSKTEDIYKKVVNKLKNNNNKNQGTVPSFICLRQPCVLVFKKKSQSAPLNKI